MRKLLPLVLVLAVPVLILWYGSRETAEPPLRAVPSSAAVAAAELEQPAVPDEPDEGATVSVLEPESEETRAALPAEERPAAPTVTVTARVVDNEGRPLAGIELVATSLASQPSTLSDADGELELVLPWDEVLAVRPQVCSFVVGGEMYTRAGERRSFSEPGEVVFLGRFELSPGGVIEGRVVDADGAPVEGARVFCVEPITAWGENDLERRRIQPGRARGGASQTDAEGRYRMEGLPLQAFSVAARADRTLASFSEPVHVALDAPNVLPDLVLEEAGPEFRIEGVVLTREGRPNAGVVVTLLSQDGDVGLGGAWADAEGRFRLVTRPGSMHRLQAGRTGHDPAIAHDVAAGTLDVVLQPGRHGSLVVRAKTQDGRTPARFSAQIQLDGQSGGSYAQAEESATIELDLPGRDFSVSLWAEGYEPDTAGPFGAEDAPRELEVELVPVTGLVGRVVSDGKPVAGALVDVHAVDPEGRVRVLRNGLHDQYSSSGRSWARSDEQGRFVLPLKIESLVQMRLETLFLHAKTEERPWGGLVRVPVGPGDAFPDVVLEAAQPGGTVEGRVVAEESRDLRGWSIALSRADSHVRTQSLDPDRAFRFEAFEPGSWQAVAGPERELERGGQGLSGYTTEDAIPWSFEVVAGRTTLFDLVLEPEPVEDVLVEGRFLVDGAPPVGWTWRLASTRPQRFDDEGRFEAALSEPGEHTLHVIAPRAGMFGMAALRAPLELIRGRNAWQYDLRTARLVVTGLPEPLEDLDEQVRRAEKESWQATWEDAAAGVLWNAQFVCAPESGLVLPEVPAGTVTLAESRYYQPVEGTEIVVELAPGEERTVDLAE